MLPQITQIFTEMNCNLLISVISGNKICFQNETKSLERVALSLIILSRNCNTKIYR